jgi:hypothetical protein
MEFHHHMINIVYNLYYYNMAQVSIDNPSFLIFFLRAVSVDANYKNTPEQNMEQYLEPTSASNDCMIEFRKPTHKHFSRTLHSTQR